MLGCGGTKTTASEDDFLVAAAEAGCTVLNPCMFYVDTKLPAIRFHATPRWYATKSTETYKSIETYKSVGVSGDSLLLSEGARIGCDGNVECEFTMLQDPPHDVLLMINELGNEDNNTIFRLSSNRLTVEK
jgi:hypothetical protein